MKKIYILTLSILILSPSAWICSSTNNETNNINDKNKTLNQQDQDCKTADNTNQEPSAQYYDDDEFDQLITDAIDNNVVSSKIDFPKPSKFETILRKFGVFFFLKPYIYTVIKYRATKKLVSQYTRILWDKIPFGKQDEPLQDNETKESAKTNLGNLDA